MFDAFIQFLLGTAFIWVPVLLAIIFWRVWISYVRADFIAAMQGGWELLEIKIPREVAKSPAAMEIVLQALHQHGSGHWYDRWWKGRVTHWFSLEIVSIEGSIYFFIRTQKAYRPIIEAQIYSQYPQAEINSVDDYTRYMEQYTRTNEWSMFGAEFGLTKEDAYPIKTYVDYGLDRSIGTLEEEQRIDPITAVVEQLGSLRPGEQFWLQMIIKKHESKITRGGKPMDAGKFEKTTRKLIEKLHKNEDDKGVSKGPLTRIQQQTLEAVERNVNKLPFDVGMRAIYLAQKTAFNPSRIAMMLGLFRQFGSNELNGFKPVLTTGTDFPWQDSFKVKVEGMKEALFHAYVNRGFFYEPYNRDSFILTTEELATLFHFPGRVSETPTFARIDAKKSEPPANLPV